MLILHTDQIEFCQVAHQEAEQITHLDAFTYLGHLFIKGESFRNEEKKQALSRSQELLDREEEVWGVLLEEENGFSLWYFSGKVEQNPEKLVPLNTETESYSSEEKEEESTNSDPSQPKFSKSILKRLKKEWEDSFRLKNNKQ